MISRDRPDGSSASSNGRVPAGEDTAVDGAPDDAQKRLALEALLQSKAFLRADQLRNFLRYICEMEIAGRAGELKEHVIGVEALGRPPGYSTADDSTVRRRAHALREKLEEVYATELAQATLHVELPKGSYVPRYVSHSRGGGLAARDTTPDVASAAAARGGPGGRVWLAAGLTAGLVLGSLATFAGLRIWPTTAVDPVLTEAWGPFAGPDANLLVCVTAPPHYGILAYPDGPLPPKVSPLPVMPGLVHWYRRRYPLEPDGRLATHLATGPIRLGEVFGLVTTIRTLDRMGSEFRIVAEKSMALPALRGRNLLLFGNPEYSYAAENLLDRADWTVTYDPASRERVVRARRGGSGTLYTPTRDARGDLAEVFGLLTVMPTEGGDGSGPRQTVIISCTNSAGCQAAAEFFASPASMRGLRERFRQEGHPGFPAAYQVVVRCRVHNVQAVSGQYEAHTTLARFGARFGWPAASGCCAKTAPATTGSA